MTWTRDNGVFRSDNPLSAGPLIDLVRNNAIHVLEQSRIDITTPLCGTTLGGGIVVNTGGASTWVGAFAQLRPFPVPIKYNSDGTFRQIQVTLDYYWTGHADSKIKLYCTSRWVDPLVVGRIGSWLSSKSGGGLIGARFQNYDEQDLPVGVGAERTITLSVTPEQDDIGTWAPNKVASENGADKVRSAPVVWLVLDLAMANSSYVNLRVMRVKDVVA